MPLRPNERAPYAPSATILDLINRFRDKGLSTPFNADVLGRASVSDSLIPRTLASLEGLELIDQQGNPTEQFEVLRRAPNAEFQARLAEIVKGVYAEVFQYASPATDTIHDIADAFRSYNPAGQRRRMVTLFVGLCDAAGLIPDGAPAKPGSKPVRTAANASARGAATIMKGRSAARSAARGGAVGGTQNGTIPSAISGLLGSLPTGGAGWTQGQRDRFLKTFEAVLDFVVPVSEPGESHDANNSDA